MLGLGIVAEPKNINEISFKQRDLDLKAQDAAEEEERKKVRKSPFSRFYQVNKDNSEYLRSCLRENPKALELLFFIFDNMDKYNAVICSYKVFQEVLGMSKATIQRSIKYLREHGFIYVYKTGASNVYVANQKLVWNSWGNNIAYCEFPANIILSASEQEPENQPQGKGKRVTAMQIQE